MHLSFEKIFIAGIHYNNLQAAAKAQNRSTQLHGLFYQANLSLLCSTIPPQNQPLNNNSLWVDYSWTREAEIVGY